MPLKRLSRSCRSGIRDRERMNTSISDLEEQGVRKRNLANAKIPSASKGKVHRDSELKLSWNEYHVADSRNISQLLGPVPVLDVTVTSPPYWDMKDYGAPGQIGLGQSLESYLDSLVQVFTDVWKRTKPTGSLWIVIKSIKKSGHLHLLPFQLAQRLTSHPMHAWHLLDVLIWHKTHTLPWAHRHKLADSYEHILCFGKSKDFSLNVDAIRSTAGITNWWVKYPERYHPYGKTLSNVWEISIPTQGSWGNGLFSHACPLPLELLKRIILLSTDKNGTVLDPFAGTGSTALAAQELGRKWLAIDVNHKYQEMFYRRLAREVPSMRTPTRTDMSSIADANLSLRQLKFAAAIFKKVAPRLRLSSNDVKAIVVRSGKSQKTASPYWVKGLRISLVLTKECFQKRASEVEVEVQDAMTVPPLSKFQMEVTVDVTTIPRLGTKHKGFKSLRLNLYSRGEFWRTTGTTSLAEIDDNTTIPKFPPIVSDIHVCEQPAY